MTENKRSGEINRAMNFCCSVNRLMTSNEVLVVKKKTNKRKHFVKNFYRITVNWRIPSFREIIKLQICQVYDESRSPPSRIAQSNLKVVSSHENNEAPFPTRNTANNRAFVITDTTRPNVLHNGYLQFVDPDTAERNILYNITELVSFNG